MIETLKHWIRRLSVAITVGAYSVVAPVGYTILAILCYCW
ncbi:MAG: hypothetical protein ACI85K_001249, partial [Hyphomicrobiaceae bacterium]